MFKFFLGPYVLSGTQACWQLLSVFFSFYWLAFLILELWMQRMFLYISLLIPMTIWFIQRKNVQLARFWSEFLVAFVGTFKCAFPVLCWWVLSTGIDLLGPSTAAFAIGVWLGLTITVDGWFAFILRHTFVFFLSFFFSIRKSQKLLVVCAMKCQHFLFLLMCISVFCHYSRIIA